MIFSRVLCAQLTKSKKGRLYPGAFITLSDAWFHGPGSILIPLPFFFLVQDTERDYATVLNWNAIKSQKRLEIHSWPHGIMALG